MHGALYSRFWLVRILLHRFVYVVLHHVQVRLDRLEDLFVVVDDTVQLVSFDYETSLVSSVLVGNPSHLLS